MEDSSEEEEEKEPEIVMPLHQMDEGIPVKVDKYDIRRSSKDVYTCSCPGWRFQKAKGSMRTCKHLVEYLGKLFEDQRLIGVKGGKQKQRDAKGDSKTVLASPQKASKIKLSLMLANVFDPEKHDPLGWLMSEKLDGVRCYWNGSKMYSRNGNQFYPPSYFKKELPDFPLDGELWTERNDFEKCVSIVKR